MITRLIPSSGEALPAIGLGTWQTFDVAPAAYAPLQTVLEVFHKAAGRLLDSSPMYGRAEEAIGNLIEAAPERKDFFLATKVWTRGAAEGRAQMEASFRKLRTGCIDLMQIHNLVDWQTHLPLLRQWKSEGRIRYIGITHYTDESHNELAALLKKETFDFVQFNYSILSRNAEKMLLPLCADKGVATLINRPFGEGALFRRVSGLPLPGWAAENGIANWGSFVLRYLLAHPAVTCVIPATGNPVHAADNLQAGDGLLPDEALRKEMVRYVEQH